MIDLKESMMKAGGKGGLDDSIVIPPKMQKNPSEDINQMNNFEIVLYMQKNEIDQLKKKQESY